MNPDTSTEAPQGVATTPTPETSASVAADVPMNTEQTSDAAMGSQPSNAEGVNSPMTLETPADTAPLTTETSSTMEAPTTTPSEADQALARMQKAISEVDSKETPSDATPGVDLPKAAEQSNSEDAVPGMPPEAKDQTMVPGAQPMEPMPGSEAAANPPVSDMTNIPMAPAEVGQQTPAPDNRSFLDKLLGRNKPAGQ